MRRALVLVVFVAAACGDNPTAPTPPPQPVLRVEVQPPADHDVWDEDQSTPTNGNTGVNGGKPLPPLEPH